MPHTAHGQDKKLAFTVYGWDLIFGSLIQLELMFLFFYGEKVRTPLHSLANEKSTFLIAIH